MSDTPTAPPPGQAPPLPGQALPGASPADPQQVRAEVDGLLSRLNEHTDTDPASSIAHSAEVLEQAHDVLVAALASLDKI